MGTDATGHTTGHTAFQAGKLLIVGDLVIGAALQLPHPELSTDFDEDRERATEARKRILQYAAENGLTVAGMHLLQDPSAPLHGLPYSIFPAD